MSSDYHAAAAALASVIARRKDVKGAVYAAVDGGNVGRVMALVSRTLDKLPLLQSVLSRLSSVPGCDFTRGGPSSRDDALLLVLLYEHAFGKGIRGGGVMKRFIAGNDALIKALCSEGDGAAAAGEGEEDAARPRYARVNTLCGTVEEAVERLCGEGAASLDRSEVALDAHIPHLLLLPADAHTRLQLHSHALIRSGTLVLQDKASTFPAAALLGDLLEPPPPGHHADDGVRAALMRAWPWQVMDACAAPGNKTSHAAALLALVHQHMRTSSAGEAYVHAYDRDPKRAALLQSRMDALHAAAHVAVHTGDCMSVTATTHPNVRAVLLDPSCSGSGMREHATGTRKRARADSDAVWPPRVPAHMFERVDALAEFQVKTLVHMLTLPGVLRVVYSTCSVYEEEDEAVVARALVEYNAAALAGARLDPLTRERVYMRAVLAPCIPSWPRRGVSHEVASNLTPAQAACVVRVHPQLDASTGFFVALVHKVRTIAPLADMGTGLQRM